MLLPALPTRICCIAGLPAGKRKKNAGSLSAKRKRKRLILDMLSNIISIAEQYTDE